MNELILTQLSTALSTQDLLHLFHVSIIARPRGLLSRAGRRLDLRKQPGRIKLGSLSSNVATQRPRSFRAAGIQPAVQLFYQSSAFSLVPFIDPSSTLPRIAISTLGSGLRAPPLLSACRPSTNSPTGSRPPRPSSPVCSASDHPACRSSRLRSSHSTLFTRSSSAAMIRTTFPHGSAGNKASLTSIC